MRFASEIIAAGQYHTRSADGDCVEISFGSPDG